MHRQLLCIEMVVEKVLLPSGWARMYSTACLTAISSVRMLRLCGHFDIPLWMASASLSGISMLNSYNIVRPASCMSHLRSLTSSIAMTTSTVSRLSRPRSLWKCDSPLSYCV